MKKIAADRNYRMSKEAGGKELFDAMQIKNIFSALKTLEGKTAYNRDTIDGAYQNLLREIKILKVRIDALEKAR